MRVQKLNDSLAKELVSIQDANECATRTLDIKDKKGRSPVNCQKQLQAFKCQLLKKLLQLLIKYELLFYGSLGARITHLDSFQAKEENHSLRAEFSQC